MKYKFIFNFKYEKIVLIDFNSLSLFFKVDMCQKC